MQFCHGNFVSFNINYRNKILTKIQLLIFNLGIFTSVLQQKSIFHFPKSIFVSVQIRVWKTESDFCTRRMIVSETKNAFCTCKLTALKLQNALRTPTRTTF
jgi:hypothetical protein